jgi:hypothetical protein
MRQRTRGSLRVLIDCDQHFLVISAIESEHMTGAVGGLALNSDIGRLPALAGQTGQYPFSPHLGHACVTLLFSVERVHLLTARSPG